jgi:hypothetical protein
VSKRSQTSKTPWSTRRFCRAQILIIPLLSSAIQATSESGRCSRRTSTVRSTLSVICHKRKGDKFIEQLIQKITENPLKYPNFRVRDGHVFKRVKRRDGELDPQWKWVVPKGSRDELLKRYHDDAATGGHLGVYKTYHKIHGSHTWSRMRADVCRYVRRSAPVSNRNNGHQPEPWVLVPKFPTRGK